VLQGEPEGTPPPSPHDSSLTREQADRVTRLIAQGMSPEAARAQVTGEDDYLRF
jgi:hypothetical protein